MSTSRIRAERALLGAVLADPPAHQHLLDIVEVDDFVRPWHGQVLAAMRRIRGWQVLPEALAVYNEIQKDVDLPATVARDGVLLANLIEASPRPAHAPAYAAMVVEGGVRQQLDLTGARLAQASQTGDLGAALHQARQTSVVIDADQSRWAALPEVVRSQLPAVPRGQPVQQIRVITRAGRATVAQSAPRARELGAAKPRPDSDP
jgi:replicative DNA helicase